MLHKKPTILSGEKPLPPAVTKRIEWIVNMDRAVQEAFKVHDTEKMLVLASQYAEHNMIRTAGFVSRLLEASKGGELQKWRMP